MTIKITLTEEQAKWLQRQMNIIHRSKTNYQHSRRHARAIYEMLRAMPWNNPEDQ